MSKTPIPIRPDVLMSGKPNQDVVDMLKEILARAEAGDIRALAYAAVTHDDVAVTSFTDGLNRFMLLGALDYVKHRINTSIED